MADFVGTDPRGVVVILRESTFSGKIAITHKELQGHRIEVELTLTSPDLILPNPKTPRTSFAGPRIADERYVRFSSAIGTNIMVPVRRVEPGAVIAAGSTTAEVRECVTAYPTESVPIVRAIWRKPT